MRISRFAPAAFLLTLAAILRWYRLPDTIVFRGDQGLDMLIVWFMDHQGHRPLVGPFLSLQNFFTPPTYYYLTWIFHLVAGSILGMVMINALANIISMIILMLLMKKMAGRTAALVLGILFSVSFIMTYQSRTFWQPFFIQVFLSGYVALLWQAFITRSLTMLWISTFLYQISLSIYPSPILLYPFVVYQIYRWYRTSGKTYPAAIFHVLLLMVTTAIPFIPQLIFESINSFPSARTMLNPSLNADIPSVISGIVKNSFRLVEIFMGLRYTNDIRGAMLLMVLVTGMYLVFRKYPLPKRLRLFLEPKPLILGLAFLSFYPLDIHSHRMWSFLPFLFIAVSLAVDRAYRSGGAYRIGALICIALYVAWNLSSVGRYILPIVTNELDEAEQIARYIRRDMYMRDIPANAAGFFHKVPNDPLNGNYDIYRVLYFLRRSEIIDLTLSPSGNTFLYDYSEQPQTPMVYLICRGYTMIHRNSCISESEYDRSYTLQTQINIGKSVVYLLKRADR